MDIQALINEISEHKSFKKTDAQLAHQETLNQWRGSEANKKQRAEQGKLLRIYTDEQVQRVRVMFWEEGKSNQDCLDYLGKGNHNGLMKVLTNKRYYDPNFKWDTSLYSKKAEQQRTRKKRSLSQQHIDILNGMDSITFEEKYGLNRFAWTNRRGWLKKSGYEIPQVVRRNAKK